MPLKMVLSGFLNLLEKIEMRRKLNEDAYELEFQKLKMLTENLKHNPDYSCNHGAQEINRCKNRYKDILPYDYTRVILTEESDKPGSDYTNANYIKGASGSAAYIACQGPLPHTVVDFWRMIWECEVKIVIMACNEKEAGKQKCENYWPEDEAKLYGNFRIELIKTQYICDDFLIRMLKVYYENEDRMVYQFHYTTWPDHGVPTSVQPILHLIQLVRKFQSSDTVPILVHCSAGCGRTGTICAIDYVWRLMISGKLKEPFNLYEIISRMRQQRIAMVQTKEQYILVHHAVAALFEQQLELIASHFYENVDEDGLPLLVHETEKEENIYEEIDCNSVLSSHTELQKSECIKEQHETTISGKQQKIPSMDSESSDTLKSAVPFIENHYTNATVYECLEESKYSVTLNESWKEGSHKSDALVNSHSVIPLTEKSSADIYNKADQLENLDHITDSSACEQNVNFTLSLPLCTVTGKSKDSSGLANSDHSANAEIESCVSCSVKIDNEGKVQILQPAKEDSCLQSNSSSYLSSCVTNSENEKVSYGTENFQHSAEVVYCANSDLGLCQIPENLSKTPFQCNTEKDESNDSTSIHQGIQSDVTEKHADIEEIFQRILNTSQNETGSKSFKSEKQYTSATTCDNLEKISKADNNILIPKIPPTELELDNSKCENFEHAKVSSVKCKESNLNKNSPSDETYKDIVLHDLTNETTQASRKRYISLVTECEQSFSEIERLLEEKNSITSGDNEKKFFGIEEALKMNQVKTESSSVILPQIENCSSTCHTNHYSKHYDDSSAGKSDKTFALQNKNYSLASDDEIKENLKLSDNLSIEDSFALSPINEQEKKVVSRDSCKIPFTQNNNSFVSKNNITPGDSKKKFFGIEEALKMNQVNDESLEYIDSGVAGQDVQNEQPEMKRSFSETEISSFNVISRKDSSDDNFSVLRSKVSDTTPPDIKMIKSNVKTEISRKEGIAQKRTGKIFEQDEVFPQLNQGKFPNISMSSKDEKDNSLLSFSLKKDISTLKKEETEPSVLRCMASKEDFTPSSQVASMQNTCNITSTAENCESVNSVSCTATGPSGGKAVVRRPSIAKLKALFEKTLPANSHSDKQPCVKHSLSRSQSHHVHRHKSTDKESIKEKYSTKPKLLNKVTKILHLPSADNNYSEACDNKFNVQWKSSDMEAISFSVESNEIPKPLVNAKEDENKSEMYDSMKDKNSTSEKPVFCPLPNESSAIYNTFRKNEAKESISDRSEVGCLDFSSLMSVVTREQNTNKTLWYEQEKNNQGNEDTNDVSHSIHDEIKEQFSENNKDYKKVTTDCTSIINSADFPCKLEEVDSSKNSLPPELPTKKKYQTPSFYSYIRQKDCTDDNTQNLFYDDLTQTTKWYYENDEKISTSSELQVEPLHDSIDNTNVDNSNANNNTVSVTDNDRYISVTNCFQGSNGSQTLEHSENTAPLPPLPPKKKINDSDKVETTNWYCNEIKANLNCGNEQYKTLDFHPYVNVLKTKDGILITDKDKTNQFHTEIQPKSDLYTNINTTSMKNIEQIENSLQQHPRGAIIDLTSRQSYANEQQSDVIKPVKYGSDPKLSETVITTDLEESHYNHEKLICRNSTEKPSFKLWQNRSETIDLTKKNTKKHYEAIWPQKETDEQIVNMTLRVNTVSNQDIQSDAVPFTSNSTSLNIKNSDGNKSSPPPKPRSPSLSKVLAKSKSSSALFMKMHDKNSASNDNSKFKDLSVNKVVCELNSILNVLTTRSFKNAQKGTIPSSEKSSDAEILPSRQHDLNQPLAPPRRKPKNDAANYTPHGADMELEGPYSPVIKNIKLPQKSVITKVDMNPSIRHISKSATMSDINKIQFVDPSKRNVPHNKEKCAKTDNPVVFHTVENLGRLPSVYENVDSVQPQTVSSESNESNAKNTFQKPLNKMNKLKHSNSDTSVFSVLRKTKCLNKDKVSTCQRDFHDVKNKSETQRQVPVINKQIVSSVTENIKPVVKVQQNDPGQNKQQLISSTSTKKIERRSMDDMDAFPIAPPRTRRHGPTPQKTVAEMKKFTSSLDDDVRHSKPHPLTRSTVSKLSGNFQPLKLPSS